MLEDIFPGIPKSVSRLGQVDGSFSSEVPIRKHQISSSGWSTVIKVPGDAISKIEAFGARVSNRNDWTESGRWVRESTRPSPSDTPLLRLAASKISLWSRLRA